MSLLIVHMKLSLPFALWEREQVRCPKVTEETLGQPLRLYARDPV